MKHFGGTFGDGLILFHIVYNNEIIKTDIAMI
jgi:hypothetical protein